MQADTAGMTVTIRRRLDKFDGDYTPGKTPVETLISEEVVPLASLPSEIQRQVLAQQKEKV